MGAYGLTFSMISGIFPKNRKTTLNFKVLIKKVIKTATNSNWYYY